MVVTEQVAQAVRREVQELGVQAAPGLTARGVERDHDVAEQVRIGGRGFDHRAFARSSRHRDAGALREREHVGGLVLAAPAGVEHADRGVVAQAHGNLEARAGRAHHARELAAQRAAQRHRQLDLVVDRELYWHLPLVQVEPAAHFSTALVNSAPVHTEPFATVPLIVSLMLPLVLSNVPTVSA